MDRERLMISALGALGLHAALFLGLNQVNWNAFSQNEPAPVYVRLEAVEPLADEEPAEAEQEEPQPEPEPEPQEEPPPQREEPQAQQRSVPSRQSPAEPSSSEPSAADQARINPLGSRAPQQSYSAEALQGESEPAADGESFRTSRGAQSGSSGPQIVEDEEPDVALPQWLRERMNQPDSSSSADTEEMEVQEQEQLAEKIQADPEFERRLRSVLSELDSSRPARSATDDGDSSGSGRPAPSSSSDSDSPGSGPNAAIQWSSTSGSRGTAGELPDFTAADFGGRVPAETTFVVVFEVDRTGTVDPGSIIFQQRSLYPRVNEKLRTAIRQWSFAGKPQAARETAIFSLTLLRSDVERSN